MVDKNGRTIGKGDYLLYWGGRPARPVLSVVERVTQRRVYHRPEEFVGTDLPYFEKDARYVLSFDERPDPDQYKDELERHFNAWIQNVQASRFLRASRR